MKVILAALFMLSGSAYAQTLTLVGSPIRVGSQATISVALSGSQSPATLAAVQWSLAFPSGLTLAPSSGSASAGVGKSVTCGPTSPQICVSVGLNANVMGNGTIATYSFTPTASGTLNFSLSGTLGATPDGSAIAVGVGIPLQLTVLSPCDLNGDGTVDSVDLANIVTQIVGLVACTSGDLDGDGKCTVFDAQRLVAAATGGTCKVGP